MADPISSAPPVPPLPPSTSAPTQPAPQPPAPPPARVLNVPAPLQNISQALSLAGQVAQTNANGVVRILTNQGDVDVQVQVSPQQAPLTQGEQVQINLPPGAPPQTAQITPYNPPPQSQPSTPNQTQSDSAPTTNAGSGPIYAPPPLPNAPAPPPPRGDQTPVEIDVSGQTAPPEPPPQYIPPPANVTDSPPPPAPLQTGQAAQLEPIPLAQVITFITPPQEIQTSLPPQIIQNAAQPAIVETAPLILTPPLANESKTSQPILSTTPSPPIQSSGVTPVPAVEGKPELPAILTQTTNGFVKILTTENFSTPPVLQKTSSPLNFSNASKPPITTAPATPQFTIRSSAAIKTPAIAAFTGRAQIFHARISDEPTPTGRIQIQEAAETVTPKESAPLVLQNVKAGAITGTVIAQTPEQFPIIAFPSFGVSSPLFGKTEPEESFFILRAPTPPLAPGTEIPFIPYDATLSDQAAPSPLSFLKPEPWLLMEQIYQALGQTSPQAAQSFANILPSPANPAALGATAMLFIAAAQGGDMTQWLSEKAVDVLRRAGRANLISKIDDEGASLNKLSSNTISQDWRAMSIPLFWDGDIRKMALYYKQDGGGQNDKNGAKQVRFIFDLSLDNMGKVQLDGLFRPARLDLIVRTTDAMSAAMQMKMREAYINALAPTEVKGELAFQNKLEQWVMIKGDVRKFGGAA